MHTHRRTHCSTLSRKTWPAKFIILTILALKYLAFNIWFYYTGTGVRMFPINFSDKPTLSKCRKEALRLSTLINNESKSNKWIIFLNIGLNILHLSYIPLFLYNIDMNFKLYFNVYRESLLVYIQRKDVKVDKHIKAHKAIFLMWDLILLTCHSEIIHQIKNYDRSTNLKGTFKKF